MPEMLTVDEQFEAIVAGVAPVAKMSPFEEPNPEDDKSGEDAPAEEQPEGDQ